MLGYQEKIKGRRVIMNASVDVLPHVKFRFNLEHPTLEECYVYGYECAKAGVDEIENPFETDSKEGEQWLEGWWAGFYGEQPLFEWKQDVTSYEGFDLKADNDIEFSDIRESYLTKVLEIAGVIAVSAILGYQVIDMVA